MSLSSSTSDVNAALPEAAEGVQARALKRRREDLFLGDAEQFAFDFGGPALEPAEDVGGGEGGTREGALDEEAVAAIAAVDDQRSLSLEEVQRYAAEAYKRGPGRFLTIPVHRKTHAPQPHRSDRSLAPPATSASSAHAHRGATLDEAILMFQEGLRRYDEALWKADRERKRAEKAREKKHQART